MAASVSSAFADDVLHGAEGERLVHAGAVVWMLRADPVAAADSSPPAAIMVEMADASESIRIEKEQKKSEATPQEELTEQTASDETKPVAKEVKDKTVVLEKAEVQLPPRMLKPDKKPKEKPGPQKKKPHPRSQQASK